MEDAEGDDMTAETLEEQFHLLRLRASNNFSYVQGSHVMRYSDLGIDAELAGDYVGWVTRKGGGHGGGGCVHAVKIPSAEAGLGAPECKRQPVACA